MFGAWGLEIDEKRIGICQARQTSHGLKVTRGTSQPIPPGLVVPSLTEPNVADEQELASQLRSLLKKAGWRWGSLVLTLPDLSCRIGHHDFEEQKGTPPEIRQLLGWRLKDRLPFLIQEARIDHQPLPAQRNGARIFYLLGREAVIAQYERVLTSVGLEPTRIITRGAALYRLQQAVGVSGTRLLVVPGPSSLLFVFTEQGIPHLWRVILWNESYQSARLLRELQETIAYLSERMGVRLTDGLILMGPVDDPLREYLREGCRLPIHYVPEPQHGVPADLVAPAGAALLHRSRALRWISR